MREAALPGPGYTPLPTRFRAADENLVRVFPEGGGNEFKDFRFHGLGIATDIQDALAEGFHLATGPAGTRRTIPSATNLYDCIRAFINVLLAHPHPPRSLADLRPAHLHELRIRHTTYANTILVSARITLRSNPEISSPFRDSLLSPLVNVPPATTVSSYTAADFRRIQRAARTEVRAAVGRIRAGEAALRSWREKHDESSPAFLGPWASAEHGRLLDFIAERGDVPRRAASRSTGSPILRDSASVFYSLFPTLSEVAALAVLFQCLTGQNMSTIARLTASYSRASGSTPGDTGVLITRARKPRRGPYAAEMDLPLTAVPEWATGTAPENDDFASAFGLYMIAQSLCRRARLFAVSDALLVFHSFTGRETTNDELGFRPLRNDALLHWKGFTDEHGTRATANSKRLRRTYLELHQRPVAHTSNTLANTYLSKDPGTLAQNQALVGRVLDGEVNRIQAAHRAMTRSDIEEARADGSGAVATRFGITADKLHDVLAGRLDTVATACVDNHNSPFTTAGQECTASFLLCLGCPCSRSEPRHIPVQALLFERIQKRQDSLGPAEWQQAYGRVSAQLEDLLRQQRTDPADAAAKATSEDSDLVEALLDGRLDLR